MAKTETLRREVSKLRGEIAEVTHAPAALRPVFELHDMEGITGYADIDGKPTEPGPDDVILTARADMMPGLCSGEDVVLLHGGRDSAKSGNVARYIVGRMLARRERVLCIRDSRQSQIESMQRLIVDILEFDARLLDHFDDITRDRIGAKNGSVLTFIGLRDYRSSAVRSYQGISIAWVEEGQTIDRHTWDTLEPTVRESGSQIFVTMNPDRAGDILHKTFIEHERPGAWVGQFLYSGNPWLSEKTLRLAGVMKTTDPAQYQHIYGGGVRMYSEARILDRVSVEDFSVDAVIERRCKSEYRTDYAETPRQNREAAARFRDMVTSSWYVGLDFGTSKAHPACLIECYLDDGPGKAIYVTTEAYGPAQDLRKYLEMARKIPRISRGWPVRCDDSRPDVIDYLNRHGVNAVAAGKGKVEEEIDVLREYEILIHPDCENAAREILGWSYKTDRGGEVIPVPDKRHDHAPDALRYAVINGARGEAVDYEYFDDMDVWG